MLDRVTHRKEMKTELVTILRMLMGIGPAVAGDLPAPGPSNDEASTEVDAAAETASGDTATETADKE